MDAWTPEAVPRYRGHHIEPKHIAPYGPREKAQANAWFEKNWNESDEAQAMQQLQDIGKYATTCPRTLPSISIARQSYGISSTAQPWEATREDDPLQPQIGKHEGVVHIQCSISSPEHCVSWCVLRVCSQRYNSRPQGFATETHASGLTPGPVEL